MLKILRIFRDSCHHSCIKGKKVIFPPFGKSQNIAKFGKIEFYRSWPFLVSRFFGMLLLLV